MRTTRGATPRRDGPSGRLVPRSRHAWWHSNGVPRVRNDRAFGRIRFDALKCNRALGLKYAGQAGITFRRRPESDALKCNRALGLKYEGRTGLRSVRLRSDALISTRVLVKDTTWSRPVRSRPRSRIDVIRWVYDPSRVTVRSEGNEDSTPAVRRIDGI